MTNKELWNNYRADQNDGFVSNTDSWIESKLEGSPEKKIQQAKEYINTKICELANIDPAYIQKDVYILECPWCGLKHQMSKENGVLLNHPDKIFSVQCASNYSSDVGCKNVIVICTQETINKIRNQKP